MSYSGAASDNRALISDKVYSLIICPFLKTVFSSLSFSSSQLTLSISRYFPSDFFICNNPVADCLVPSSVTGFLKF